MVLSPSAATPPPEAQLVERPDQEDLATETSRKWLVSPDNSTPTERVLTPVELRM